MKRVLVPLALLPMVLCACSNLQLNHINNDAEYPYEQGQSTEILWAIPPTLSEQPDVQRNDDLAVLQNKVYFDSGLVLFSKDENNLSYTGVANFQGNILLEPEFYHCGFLPEGYLILNSDSKAVLLAPNGRISTLPNANWTDGFYSLPDSSYVNCQPLLLAMKDMSKGTAFYINTNGEIELGDYQEARPFNEGLAAVKVDNLFGYINADGDYAINPRYVEAGTFSNGVAVVKEHENPYVIDQFGNVIISGKWTAISSFQNDTAIIEKRDCYGVINLDGEVLLEPIFNRISRYENQFVVQSNQGIGLWSPGEESVHFYGEIRPIDREFAITKKGEKYGLTSLRPDGSEIIKPSLFSLRYLGEGLFYASPDGKSAGLLDKRGEWIVSPKNNIRIPLDNTGFSRGLLPVLYQEKWGVLVNPLIYGGWAESESARAELLGLYPVGEPITLQTAASMAEQAGVRRQALSCAFVLPECADASVAWAQLLPDENRIATRADAAYMIASLAKAQGEVTGNYTCGYSDIQELPSEMQAAVAYVMGNELFNCADDTTFEPNAAITDTEMAVALVRFVEGSLDTTNDVDQRIFSKHLA